jgi:hypothetical protein
MSDSTSQHPLEQGVEMVVPPVGAGATLTIPAGARGIVLFAHGSGSLPRPPPCRTSLVLPTILKPPGTRRG